MIINQLGPSDYYIYMIINHLGPSGYFIYIYHQFYHCPHTMYLCLSYDHQNKRRLLL